MGKILETFLKDNKQRKICSTRLIIEKFKSKLQDITSHTLMAKLTKSVDKNMRKLDNMQHNAKQCNHCRK